MSVSTILVEQQFTNVVAGTPVVAGIQTKGDPADIAVTYGAGHLGAVQGVDYLIAIASDMLSVTITPQASLLTKIAANGPNVIYVTRRLTLTTSFDYDDAFVRQELVDEFDRVFMIFQQVQFDATSGTDSKVATLTNKTIDANLNTISNIDNSEIKAGAAIDATKIANGQVNNTEFQYLANVTSDIQTQLNNLTGPGLVPIKPLNPVADTFAYYTGAATAALTAITAFGRSLVAAIDAAATKTLLSLQNVDNTSDDTKNAAVKTLTNKTIVASPTGTNTITGIANGSIAAGAAIDATKIANGSVTNTEFQALDNITGNIQTQIDGIPAAAMVLTNKTFNADGTGNSITNIENADIKAGAAIDATKIGDGSVTNAEFQTLQTARSDLQIQIDAISAASGGGPGTAPIAPLNPSAGGNQIAYYTSNTTAALTTLSPYGRTLIDDADALTARATLGVVIGTNVQAQDATLQSISLLGTAADKLAYTTGVDTWAETAFTAFARTLLDDTTQAAMQTTLGLVIGTNVQAYDATLASIATRGTAADRMLYTTGVDAWAEAVITTYGRSLVDDADATTARGTLGLGTAAVANTGASGHNIPFEDVANTWSATQTFATINATAIQEGGVALLNKYAPDFGSCRLTKSGANLLLSRYSGYLLFINGTWQVIPVGGVTLAPPATTLTNYYIYAWMNGATMTLEASTTAPATDATYGHRIKTGDATRTLVGQARTVTNLWIDDDTRRFVISYFNRRDLGLSRFLTANRATASTSFIEMPETRVEFLQWDDETTEAYFGGCSSTASAASRSMVSIAFDGAVEDCGSRSMQSNAGVEMNNACGFVKSGLTEGYHYACAFYAASNTQTLTFFNIGVVNTGISVKIRG